MSRLPHFRPARPGAVLALAACAVWSACAVRPVDVPQGPVFDMTRVGRYDTEQDLRTFAAAHGEPLVVYQHGVYSPAPECLPSRRQGGDDAGRRLGGDEEGRRRGGDEEGRRLGGDAEGRRLGGDQDGRNLGGAEEGRRVGGDEEGRRLGGDAEGRRVGGDEEGRRLGGDAEGRRLGGDQDGRNLGGAEEDRRVGGDEEGRRLGGDALALTCSALASNRGFYAMAPAPADLRVYVDGDLREVPDGVVRY